MIEALSGLAEADRQAYSPQITSQEGVHQERNGFPRNNLEFLRYLLIDKSPTDRIFELVEAALDVQKAAYEWWMLQNSPIFRGEGTPKGEGTVVIGSGFLTTKFNCLDTAHVFKMLGYEPVIYIPKPGINIPPVQHNESDFMDFLNAIPGQVYLVVHSKAALQAYAAYATRRDEFTAKVKHWAQVAGPRPDFVSSVIGTPYLGTQIVYGGDDFKFADEILSIVDLENIDGTIVTAIGNPNDPIIRGKMIGKPEDQFEVDSSHSGSLVNPKVLGIITKRFAELKAAA